MTAQPVRAEPDVAAVQLLREGLEIVAARALGAGDDCRDAVQETLFRTIAALRTGTAPDAVPLAAFAHGILKHVIADCYRARQRDGRASADLDRLTAAQPSPLEQLVGAEERMQMARAVASLGHADRALLHACYVAGERLTDLAARLGEPPARVRKRKSRALARLRAAFGQSGGHDSPARPT